MIEITAGSPVRFELLLASPLPDESDCHCKLYLLGGSSAVLASSQTKFIATKPEGKKGYRASFDIDLPASIRAGTRFLLKIETSAPIANASATLLGEVELEVVELTPADEIRAFFKTHSVQLSGKSRRLRELLDALQLPVSTSATFPPKSVVLTEESVRLPADRAASLIVFVRFRQNSSDTLAITGQKRGEGWLVETRLPRSHDLSSPNEGAADLAEILRFIQKLETPE